MTATKQSNGVAHAVRQALLELAKQESDLAADHLAQVPYWSPVPPIAVGHREAARVLRQCADRY